jgi:integrase
MRKPYFRSDRGAWYVKTRGGQTQVRLHEDEQEAYRVWHELRALDRPDCPDSPLEVIAEHYLAAVQRTVSDLHYARTAQYIADFCNSHGKKPARQLKPFDVNRWVASHRAWGPWSQRGAISSIKRALNWAVDEGLLEKNPIARIKLPSAGRREVLISDSQHRDIISQTPNGRAPSKTELCFRQMLIALRHSGARPGSIAAVTAEDVTPEVDSWVLRQHKTAKKTGKPLTVYLSPCLQTLTKILLHRRKAGPLFVNSRGKKWTRSAVRQRMMRLREKLDLPDGLVAYGYRHSYATNMLEAGVPMATVAELLGHRSTKMLSAYYSHLEQRSEHLKKAAGRSIACEV